MGECGDERVGVAELGGQLPPARSRRELEIGPDDVDRPVLELLEGGVDGRGAERPLDYVEDLAGGDGRQSELELFGFRGKEELVDDRPPGLLPEGRDERLGVEDDDRSGK